MEPLGPGQIRLRIYGPDVAREELSVSGLVFAQKLMALVNALRAADAAVNGKRVHDFFIAKLKSSTPAVTLTETLAPKVKAQFDTQSAIPAFHDCALAVIAGKYVRARKYGKCSFFLNKLSSGSRKQYGYGEVWVSTTEAIRIDEFLSERAESMSAQTTPTNKWYKGTVSGSFDGKIEAVDLRGALPEITLILVAGGKQIDCICHEEHIEDIRRVLHKRARVTGDAVYDGQSGLPRRVIVRTIEPSGVGTSDFSIWKGSFRPFDVPEWDEDGR